MGIDLREYCGDPFDADRSEQLYSDDMSLCMACDESLAAERDEQLEAEPQNIIYGDTND